MPVGKARPSSGSSPCWISARSLIPSPSVSTAPKLVPITSSISSVNPSLSESSPFEEPKITSGSSIRSPDSPVCTNVRAIEELIGSTHVTATDRSGGRTTSVSRPSVLVCVRNSKSFSTSIRTKWDCALGFVFSSKKDLRWSGATSRTSYKRSNKLENPATSSSIANCFSCWFFCSKSVKSIKSTSNSRISIKSWMASRISDERSTSSKSSDNKSIELIWVVLISCTVNSFSAKSKRVFLNSLGSFCELESPTSSTLLKGKGKAFLKASDRSFKAFFLRSSALSVFPLKASPIISVISLKKFPTPMGIFKTLDAGLPPCFARRLAAAPKRLISFESNDGSLSPLPPPPSSSSSSLPVLLSSLEEFGGLLFVGTPGFAKCHPGARIPTPGSDSIINPSSLTVPVPITSQSPASWLKDQMRLFSPGSNPSKLGNTTGAGTSKVVAPSAWMEITKLGSRFGGRGAGSRSGLTGTIAACVATLPFSSCAEPAGNVTRTCSQTAGSTSGKSSSNCAVPASPKPTSVFSVVESCSISPAAIGGR